MQVRMHMQVLAPSVKHSEKADGGSEQPRGGCGFQQRGSGGAEQNGVDLFRVLKRQPANLCGQGKDHVEIGNRQQLGFALLEPASARHGLALGAMPVATRNGELTITPLRVLWGVFSNGEY